MKKIFIFSLLMVVLAGMYEFGIAASETWKKLPVKYEKEYQSEKQEWGDKVRGKALTPEVIKLVIEKTWPDCTPKFLSRYEWLVRRHPDKSEMVLFENAIIDDYWARCD